MCCLVEKAPSQKSHQDYFGQLFGGHNPKRLQKKARQYFNILPGVSHGKFVKVSEYFTTGDKRGVLISPATDIASEFPVLTKQWKNDTRCVSSLSEMFLHPAYQRIMAMGKPALPFILHDLLRNSGHWFHALQYIAGKDIAAGTETTADARAAWLEWGFREGYL
jgi:hypothetical protein